LRDLKDGNVLLPPDLDTTSGLEVVPVHNNVNHEVQGDGHPRNRCVAMKLGKAEKSSGAVVVRMQESEGLLLKEEENGVNELEVLREVVQLV